MWSPPGLHAWSSSFLAVHASLGFHSKKVWHVFLFCADDTQLYLPLKVKATSPLGPLVDCLIDIKAWMALNFLKLNETEAVIFGPHGGCAIQSIGLFPLEPFLKPSVKNQGVIMNKDLKMDQQINSVVRSSFFQLRLLSKVKSF